jgi:hypothetical protein
VAWVSRSHQWKQQSSEVSELDALQDCLVNQKVVRRLSLLGVSCNFAGLFVSAFFLGDRRFNFAGVPFESLLPSVVIDANWRLPSLLMHPCQTEIAL